MRTLKKTPLTILLALLVVVQAAVAVADVHRYELGACAGASHVEHSHRELCDSTAPELPAPDHNAQDCEHCCHCHGSAVAALAYQIPLLRHDFVFQLAPVKALQPMRLCERSIRPPIA